MFLSEAIYRRPIIDLPADRFTARDRYSPGPIPSRTPEPKKPDVAGPFALG